jgi:hypothetical protein
MVAIQIDADTERFGSQTAHRQCVQKTAPFIPFVPEVKHIPDSTAHDGKNIVQYKQIPLKSVIIKSRNKEAEKIFHKVKAEIHTEKVNENVNSRIFIGRAKVNY